MAIRIEETSEEARQGGRGFDIFVVLVVSTLLAAVALWGIFAIWAGTNAGVDDTTVPPEDAAIVAPVPEAPGDTEALAGAPAGETPPD